MAAATASVQKDIHLETFSLIWLGIFIHKKEKNINLQKQLRASIKHLNTFENSDQCEQHIQSVSKHDRIVLIVNDQLDREVIHCIHQLRQASNIYINCNNNQQNQEWTQQCNKSAK